MEMIGKVRRMKLREQLSNSKAFILALTRSMVFAGTVAFFLARPTFQSSDVN